jgi:hypothetical protein
LATRRKFPFGFVGIVVVSTKDVTMMHLNLTACPELSAATAYAPVTRRWSLSRSRVTGSAFSQASWPGGVETTFFPLGCFVTIKMPSKGIDLIGNLGDKFNVSSWSG